MAINLIIAMINGRNYFNYIFIQVTIKRSTTIRTGYTKAYVYILYDI